jgi:hypothetical protein
LECSTIYLFPPNRGANQSGRISLSRVLTKPKASKIQRFFPSICGNAHGYHNLYLCHQPRPKMMPTIIKSHTHSYEGRGQLQSTYIGQKEIIQLFFVWCTQHTCEYPSPSSFFKKTNPIF